MIKKKTQEKVSNLSKISPSFWPLGLAVGVTSSLLTGIVLVYSSTMTVKFLFISSLILMVLSLYKWMMLLLNNK